MCMRLQRVTFDANRHFTILEGVTRPQGMGLYGGVHQAYLRVELVPKEWIKIAPMERNCNKASKGIFTDT